MTEAEERANFLLAIENDQPEVLADLQATVLGPYRRRWRAEEQLGSRPLRRDARARRKTESQQRGADKRLLLALHAWGQRHHLPTWVLQAGLDALAFHGDSDEPLVTWGALSLGASWGTGEGDPARGR